MDHLVIDYLRCRRGRIGRRHSEVRQCLPFPDGANTVAHVDVWNFFFSCNLKEADICSATHSSLGGKLEGGNSRVTFSFLRRIGCRAARIQVCQMYSSRSLAVLFPSSLSDISASGGRWLKKPSRQRKAAVDVLSVVYLSVTQPHWKLKNKD